MCICSSIGTDTGIAAGVCLKKLQISRVYVDPMAFMRENNYKFGFIATTSEKPDFTADLFELHEACVCVCVNVCVCVCVCVWLGCVGMNYLRSGLFNKLIYRLRGIIFFNL